MARFSAQTLTKTRPILWFGTRLVSCQATTVGVCQPSVADAGSVRLAAVWPMSASGAGRQWAFSPQPPDASIATTTRANEAITRFTTTAASASTLWPLGGTPQSSHHARRRIDGDVSLAASGALGDQQIQVRRGGSHRSAALRHGPSSAARYRISRRDPCQRAPAPISRRSSGG